MDIPTPPGGPSRAVAPIARIFLSHSHHDDAFTLRLAEQLRAAGAYVWLDMRDIKEGDFLKRINEGLVKCDWLVLVETPASLSSEPVEMEVNAAQNRVLYHQMRGVIRFVAAPRDPRSVPPTWATLQYYDATSSYSAAFARLLDAVREPAPAGATPPSMPAPSPELPTAPAKPEQPVAQRLPAEIHAAYDAADWHAVADKSALLLRLAPDTAGVELYRLRGRALLELGDEAGAVTAFEAALKRDPLNLPTLRATARAYVRAQQHAKAAPLLQDAMALVSTPAERLDILREYVPVLQALNRWGDVLARCDEALRLQREDPAWLALRMDALTHLGRADDALAVARQLTSGNTATADNWLARAKLARTAGELSEAAQALLALGRLGAPETTVAPEREATLKALRAEREGLTQRQQWTAALRLIDEELALRPSDRALLIARARLLEATGEHQRALAQAREIEAAARESGDWLDLCTLYVSLGRAADAWACVERSGLMTGSQPQGEQTSRLLTLLRAIAKLPDVPTAVWPALARMLLLVEHKSDEAWSALASAERAGAAPALIGRTRAELFPPPTVAPALSRLGFVGQNLAGAQVLLPPVCLVPAGPFLMGSDPRQDNQAQANEQPQQQVTLAAYQIGKFPVTVAEYACFVASGHTAPGDWSTQQGKLDHPVVQVSWHDATAYAAWLAKLTGQPWRLPTEAQWEKAARWDPARRASRLYPWGDRFDQARCNTYESSIRGTTAVGAYGPENPSRDGSSPCGAQDMAGNVWEWTSTLYKPYPYTESDGRENPNSSENRVLRGGSWGSYSRYARAAYRDFNQPDNALDGIGFRVALLSAAPSSF